MGNNNDAATKHGRLKTTSVMEILEHYADVFEDSNVVVTSESTYTTGTCNNVEDLELDESIKQFNSKYYIKEISKIQKFEKVAAYVRNFKQLNELNYMSMNMLMRACAIAYIKEQELEITEHKNLHRISDMLKVSSIVTFDGKEGSKVYGYAVKNISEGSIKIQLEDREIELTKGKKTCLTHYELIYLLADKEINGKISNTEIQLDTELNLSKIINKKELVDKVSLKCTSEDGFKYTSISNMSKESNIEYLINILKQEQKKKDKQQRFKNRVYV